MSVINIEEIEELKKTSIYFKNLIDEIIYCKNKSLDKAEKLVTETKIEKNFSHKLLMEARTRKLLAFNRMMVACSCEPPIDCPSATIEYNKASKHLKNMERRYKLAKECEEFAEIMYKGLESRLQENSYAINQIVNSQTPRLEKAFEDLNNYYKRLTPNDIEKIEKYSKWMPKEKNPVMPDTIRERLTVDEIMIENILYDLYLNDENFKEITDRYRLEEKNKGKEYVEIQIKKNISGRIAEEIVIRGLSNLGENVETQSRTYMDDGSYTKTDLIIKNLRQPVILHKGSEMGAREGNDLAIEVKSGNKKYIFSQKEHMIFQSKGHKNSKISCTITTRDIKDLSEKKELDIRNALKDAGSPIIGMLPKKSEIDEICINFVLGATK
jgi:hypothetical protein